VSSTHTSSILSPAPGWAKRMPADERLFLGIVVVVAVAMSAFTIGWIFFSSHNVPTASYPTTPVKFAQQVSAFAAKYGRADGKVVVPPGKDAYVLAARFTFYPELVLKAGHRYRIWLSSADALHGFSLVGGGENLNLEIAPNHAYGADFTPAKPGTYLIVCNEFCGLGHHKMTGRITVTS
jgi:cytochrome c oxidase subunit 2